MDQRLSDVLAAVEQAAIAAPLGWPSPTPAAGQSREEWAHEVARFREQHNTQASEILRIVASDAKRLPARTVYAEIPVAMGMITARIYVPHSPGVHPGILFLHGGGWWIAGGATGFSINDRLCRQLSASLSAVVVNADYRLAPEHPYPAQLEDAYASLVWMHATSGAFGFDASRLAVFGISSGGNLAAALSCLTRDRGGPALRAQLLVVPALDLTVSSQPFLDDPKRRATAMLVRSYYAQGRDLRDPYLSPALASDLAGLPPAEIVIGEFDHVREEGVAYAQRLADAGVPANVRSYPMAHEIATRDVQERWKSDLFEAARGHLRPVAA